MSDERNQTTTPSSRPAPYGYDTWPAYWHAQGMPWRTEPEIDEERQRFLAERRAIRPDSLRGIYPFRGVRLSRADVEWLLATHDDGFGHRGPVEWQGEHRWRLDGPDLRGAVLSGETLSGLPLTRLLGSLRFMEWLRATPEERELAAVHLERCTLWETSLEGANLRSAHLEAAILKDTHMQGARLHGAHLEGASFPYAHLEGARLQGAHFGGRRLGQEDLTQLRARALDFPEWLLPADLRFVFFDAATELEGILLGDHRLGWASLANARWGGANITVVEWAQVETLGDEREARQSRDAGGKPKGRDARRAEYRSAVRAYRQLAAVLREQGVHEDADRFAYRAQLLQRVVLRRQGQWGRWMFSGFLDAIGGYGYRPLRSLATYVLVVIGFALAYYFLGPLAHLQLQPLAALVFSVTSFHGRGFAPAEHVALTNPLTVLAAVEAIIGLLIEITFIATFTQRFFAR